MAAKLAAPTNNTSLENIVQENVEPLISKRDASTAATTIFRVRLSQLPKWMRSHKAPK